MLWLSILDNFPLTRTRNTVTMFRTLLSLTIWNLQKDWWERKEKDKRKCNSMIKTWQTEQNEQLRLIMVLLKEIKSCNKNKNLIRRDDKWLQNQKQSETRIFYKLKNLSQNNKQNTRLNRERFTSKLSYTNKQCERNISITMGKWPKKKRIWISSIFKRFETKKLTCIQWFLESTTSTLLELSQWTE